MALRALTIPQLRKAASSTSSSHFFAPLSTTTSSASLSTSSAGADLPRITERRPSETGRGGRASDAGVKVALFGATGFLGRYVSSGLGESYYYYFLWIIYVDLYAVEGEGIYDVILRRVDVNILCVCNN